MRKIVLTYGLIADGILSGMMLLAMPFHEQIGFDKGMIIGYTTMVVAFLMVFFGVRAYRDTVAGGTIGFGRAFQVGILITLIATICYVATWQVIYRTFASDYLDKYAEYTLEKARAGGASEAEIARRQAELAEFAEDYQNPIINIAYTALEPLPVGVVFTLLAAGVLSRKRKVVNPQTA